MISSKELEAETGVKVEAKYILVLAGGRMWKRVDGGWEEYPPYPEPVA